MRGMVPEDVYELTGADDPRVSPDGTTVAYRVWRVDRDKNTYPSELWVAAVDGSTPPRRFTSGEHRDSSPRWSPDGSRLAFVSARGDAKAKAQIYVIPVAGGEAVKLTDLKESAGDPVWSPDGARIAFVARERAAEYDEEDGKKRAPRRITRLQFKLDNEGWTADRHAHIFVVPADGSIEPVQLTHGDNEDGVPAWSPDGRTLAFASARGDDWDITPGNDIFLLDIESGDLRAITNTDGWFGQPSFSDDGARIACSWSPAEGWDEPRHNQIAVIDVATGARAVLTSSLDRNCSPYPPVREPIWFGEQILFAVEDSGNTPLYVVASDGSTQPAFVLGGDFALTGFDLAAGQGVHTASSPGSLSEVFYGDEQLTNIGEPFTSARAIGGPERFIAKSKDGAEVEAWIIRPPDFDPERSYPVLLSIHGGPFTQYGNRFFDEFQVYAGAGYVVLYSNPRGSSGYTEAWGRAIRGPADGQGPGWGTVDYEDCMAVVDTALETFPGLDANRLGVIGGSYGGYMTSWIIGHTDRFAAAVSERAVNEWISMWGSSDFGWTFKGSIGSNLWEDFEAWRALSPMKFAQNIKTPVLILHSENDLRCDVEQAEQLFTTLRLLKREVEFVRFPEEGHELSRSGSPVHRVQRFEVILEWFARYLKPETA